MKLIFKKVLSHPELISRPPVLIDIGAAGNLPKQWNLIARYSTCVAFDADTRDFSIAEGSGGNFKKVYLINRLVAAHPASEVDFYLTSSPHCSSTLAPDVDALQPWAFRHLFSVEKVVKMPAVDLHSSLTAIGLDYIDWYKTDTQGTDLRIFSSLPLEIINKIIVAEFEPGIIDAYIGEDKLHHLMAYMDTMPFWITHIEVKGSQRIDHEDLLELELTQSNNTDIFTKSAPGWCEISYLNKFDNDKFDIRDHLLCWIFATIKSEHGYALHMAKAGKSRFNDHIFDDMIMCSRKSLRNNFIKAGVKTASKLLRRIHEEIS